MPVEPSVSEVPSVPVEPSVPVVPSVSEVSSVHVVPAVPVVPSVSEVPSVHVVPAVPNNVQCKARRRYNFHFFTFLPISQ